MNQSRLQWKVGLFVFVCLTLLAVLLLQFSKGTSFFRKTYELKLKANNAGTLKAQAQVLMSGVQVGRVTDIRLAADGKSVTIFLRIYGDYVIHHDARFIIEQSGFLGDQYVAIAPTENAGPILKDGEEVTAEAPFNLQEVAREASGFIQRIDETAKRLNDTIADVRRHLLNEQTLTNLAITAGNFRQVSEHAMTTVDSISVLVETNTAPLSMSVSNLRAFSERINVFGDSLQSVLNTNRAHIDAALENIEVSTIMLTNLLNDVRSGKGVAGSLIKNEELARNLGELVNNVAIASSNLNRLGLWRMLWKPRLEKTNSPAPLLLRAPKDQSQ